MPLRDYANRKSNNSYSGKWIVIGLALFILLSFIGALVFLKENAPSANQIATPTLPVQNNKAELPSKPQENWSFVRNLETREIPVEKALTEEQHQALKALEQEKRLQEEKRIAAEKAATEQLLKASEEKPESQTIRKADESAEQLATEKKRQQVNILKKQQEAKAKSEEQLQAEKAKAELLKVEKTKAEAQKKIKAEEAKKQVQATTQEAAAKSVAKFGLQCGAFKNKAQAENMQARLAMAGYSARINTSAEWNRVVVGPLGDRNAAISAQSNAKSIADCVVVGM